MIRTISVNKNNINRYELEIARSGCCRSLANISFAEDDSFYSISSEICNVSSMDSLFDEYGAGIFDPYILLIDFLIAVCRSVIDAEDYLIDPKHISLHPDDIFLSNKRVLLIFTENSMDFMDSMKFLMEYIGRKNPRTHGDFLCSRIPEYYDAHELERFLTWTRIDLYSM